MFPILVELSHISAETENGTSLTIPSYVNAALKINVDAHHRCDPGLARS